MATTIDKDPSAILDYTFDWAKWLAAGETISTSTWTVSNVTKDSDSNTTTTATVWLSGGIAGTSGSAVNRIVTSAGRQDERTLMITVTDR